MTDSHFSHQGRRIVWLAGVLILMLMARNGVDIFAGTMPGNDDMMRLQQIRDLLGGQGWFDVDQSRFLTPEGGEMHWSRLPDLFIAGVVLLTKPFLGQANAEALGSVLWPLFVLGWTLAAMATVLRRMGVGAAGQVAAILIFGLGGSAAIYNFWPGRIDHHNLVVAFVLTGLTALLSPRLSMRSAIVLALCLLGTLSVAIEGLPYVGGLVLAMGVLWIVRGHAEATRMTVFGMALIIFAIAFFLLDAPGFGARRFVCDAYGASHFAGLVCGGALFAALGSFGGNISAWTARLGAGAVAGVITLAVIVGVQPDCLGDPYANVSEQARLAWLDGVKEAKSLPLVWQQSRDETIWKYGFLLAALMATAVFVRRAPKGLHLPRAVFAGLLGLAALATVWQVRGTTFSHLFAVMVAGWAIGGLAAHWWKVRGIGPVLMLCGAVFLLTPLVWQTAARTVFPPANVSKLTPDGEPYGVACRKPDAYADLAAREPLNVFSSIDLGTSILMRTPHSIFAAPYHRNVAGIERATDVYMGAPDAARDKMLSMGATHFLYCQGLGETARYARLRPDSFAAMMEAGEVPDWLIADDGLSQTDGVVRVYRIKP